MSDNTVYLITGANRGIGHAITSHLLNRPHTTVIATSRRLPTTSLTSFAGPIHPTSRLVPVLLDETQPAATSATLAARLAADHGIAAVDVVVANAGGSAMLGGVLSAGLVEAVRKDVEVNALGVVALFQGVWPLLEEASGSGSASSGDGGGGGGGGGGKKEKKFVLMSSMVGSIGGLEGGESLPLAAYGMSKAAANWFAKKVSVELKGRVTVGIIHPGWVQTTLGQVLADELGVKEPPMTAEESARAVVEQIDGLTPEKSGQYLTYTGDQLPW